ncbi:MAG: hypothetical protein AAF542_25885 [Pseudomonadota bacterium]
MTFGVTCVVPQRIESDAKGKQDQAQVHVTPYHGALALSPVAAMELARALTDILITLSKIVGGKV